MIAELGHYALTLALIVSLLQSVVPMVGAARKDGRLMGFAAPCAVMQLTLVAAAFLALTNGFVTSDFSLRVVAENSHATKPLIYKITGVWGNHEGSMLLWSLILAAYGAAVAWFGDGLPATLRARVIGIQGMVGLGFLAFILLTSNPFDRLDPAPIAGMGLNPVLQDLALAIHPPMLYLGYVGFSIAFSFAIAALIEGKVDAAWARWVRPWTLAAWSCLTLGIALGSWWAYYELGWGGWWFWDPVENASLMPWLLGTALIHCVVVVERREALRAWTMLLAIMTFGLSLLGTFLVRSGVLTSVHAFAVDPDRGLFVLLLLAIAVGGGLALYALRAPSLRQGPAFALISREGGLVLNNLFLAVACATVLLGTLYPLIAEVISNDRVSVGPPFYDATFVPLMMPMLAAMAIGPMLAWRKADLAGAFSRLSVAVLVVIVVLAIGWYVTDGGPLLALVGLGLAAWLIMGALTDLAERIALFRRPLSVSLRRAAGLPRSAYGSMLAHGGVGVLVAGAVAATAWKIESIQMTRPGQTVDMGSYQVRLDDVSRVGGPNYVADRASMTVFYDGEAIGMLTPERRFYPVERQSTTESAIRGGVFGDLYAVIGEPDDSGAWVTRIYYEPLVAWIWFGAGMMAVGGALSLSDRRAKVGAATRAAKVTELAVEA
ncbi:MAG: heme lyase CcmF/NrfE family subunit [Alphaproteobacteria bacterium]